MMALRRLALIALWSAAFSIHAAASTLITNIQLIDGSGAPSRSASVRIDGTRIIEVGVLSARIGETVLDGEGKTLAPGFIDTHSHHDRMMDSDVGNLATTSQGITTIIVGQDGVSNLPLTDYFETLERNPLAINLGSFSGHNSLRHEVMGMAKRAATGAEIAKMNQLLEADLKAGALGLGSGLEYEPGLYATTKEVITLAKTAARYGGRYISHIRSEDLKIEDAMAEIITIGREAKIPVQISHIKLAHSRLWGQAADYIKQFEAARAEGVDITADIYPYTYWQSTMQILFPDRDYTDRAAIENAFTTIVQADKLYFSNYTPDPSYNGKTIAEIAELRGEDVVTAYLALAQQFETLINTNPDGSHDATIIAVSMHEEDVATLMAWQHTNICSDGVGEAGGHPRGFGSFPRVLGHYVREKDLLTLEQAIHKMTALPARHMGIKGRGLIKAGYYADMVLFDPETVADKAKIGTPQALSTGIETVWVNGTVVYQNQQLTGQTPGHILRGR